MNRKFTIIIALVFFIAITTAQNLKPGFDKNEFIELLKLAAKHTNPNHFSDVPYPDKFKLVYRSNSIGLDNAWELWKSPDNIITLSIRGTTRKSVSWIENFYSAMVPAKGKLQLSATDTFKYELAQNPHAAVHVGWLLATAYLSKEILPKLDSCYKAGIKDVYIVGYSQGGGISFLLTAYLYNLQKQHVLPADIRFKTYCCAAPKPGNLFFAYEYEAKTQAGWAYNAVNTDDWVPLTPVSVQTTDDFGDINPFTDARKTIKKQKFPKDVVLKHIYNKMDKPSRKAQKRYEKYLGNKISKFVKKNLPSFQPPIYFKSDNYVRCGNTIVLTGDSAYYKLYPIEKDKLFTHHYPAPYLFLMNKYPN
ncbi:MAG: lipase family protein [Bacteroidia bacterium]